MNSIKRLQSGVSNSLRSNIILFDLPRVVEELTYNSVDSGATKVYISISLEACYVKVEDDGCGITRDSLVILGERYATSKVHLPAEAETSSGGYGFRGESLASLSDVSLVEVRTKVHGMPNAFCKILKGSKCLSLGIDDQKEAVGTTVIVRDLFYNQPVRRTYMHSSSKRVLHSVKKCVMRIALVHPQVSFKVTDIASEDDLLCTVPSSCPLPLVSDAFGNEVASSLQEIVLSDHLLMLSGYLSRLANAFSTKAFQYLYINSRFITKGPIHNLLNNVAASFQCSLPQHTAESKFQSGKRHKPEGYPAFLLNLRCPLYSYDLHFEPSKTVVEFKDWNTILCFIERAIKQVWGKELEKPLQGDPVVHTDCASMETAIQEEGILKRFKLKNAHSRSPITNPLDISVEDTDVYRGRGISSAEMHSFSFLKPCQKKASYLTQAPCSPHNIHDSLDGFASPCAQMGSANSTGHWACDISSFVLDNFLDWTPKSEDRFLASDRKWNNNLPEDSRSLENDASHILPKFDPFDFIDSDEKSPFSVPCYRYSNMEKECLHSLDYDQGCFAFNKKHNSFGVGLDDLGNNSSFVDSSDTVKEDSPFNRKGGLLWDTLSLEKGDGSKFWVTRSNIRSPEMDWYNSSSQKLSAKRLKTEYEYAQVSNSRGHLPYTKNSDKEEVLTEYDYAPGTNMQYESPSNQILGKVNPSPFPNFRTGWSPLLTNMQYESPSNKIDLGKVNPSPWSNFLTGWSPAESSNMKSYAIHSQCAHMQNQNKGSENLWYELECQNYQSSDVCKVRSRRSCSAPPFYRGKYRFPTLNDHVTRGVARKDTSVPKASPENIFSSKGLSQPCCVSQPCLELCVNEITRPILRQGCVDKKRSPHEMLEVQNYGGSDRVCDSQLSHNTAAEGPISEQLEYTLATTSKWQTGVQQTTERDDSNISKDDILNVSSGILHLSGSSLIPDSINKDSLKDARVLLQLDRKFIPVIASNILVIVDQHAADERIRLEELRDKVLSGEGTAVTYLDSEQELVLPEMGFQLLQKYADQIQKWGWIYNIHSQCSDSFVKNVNLLKRPRHGVTLLAVPCILGINLNGKDLLEFIEQLVETDGSSTIPPSVLRILNFKACRGAIMFGDSLLPSECSLILEELKATSLCFQCAHGRPTTVPLLNMTSLHELLGKLEMEKMGPEDTWHGLRRHAPTLERAQMRLESTKRFHRG